MKKILLSLLIYSLCTSVCHSETGEFIVEDYISGYKAIWTTNNQVTIEPGKAGDASNILYIILSTNLTIDIAVSGTNGLDAGSETSNQWYAVYICSDGTTVFGLLSTNETTPTGPLFYRRVGYVMNNSNSDFMKFVQHWKGRTRRYKWDEAPSEIRPLLNGNATSYTDVDLSPYMPPSSRNALIEMQFETGTGGSKSDDLKIKPSGTMFAFLKLSSGVKSSDKIIVPAQISTDSSQIISYHVTASANGVTILVRGFDDEI